MVVQTTAGKAEGSTVSGLVYRRDVLEPQWLLGDVCQVPGGQWWLRPLGLTLSCSQERE